MMVLFGIQLKKPDQKDLFVVSLIVLTMLLINIPLAETMGANPQSLLAWTMAGASGAILSASGIRPSEGMKQLIIISSIALLFGFIGHLLGGGLLMLVKN